MTAVINVALPVFGLILAGWIGGRVGLLGRASSEALNKFVYWFSLPALLFGAMARTPIEEIVRLDFIGAFLTGTFAIMLAAGLLGAAIHRTGVAEATMQAMNAGFSNTGYMGIPLFAAAFGSAGVAAATLATVLVSTVVIGVMVMILELAGDRPGRPLSRLAGALGALAINPLVVVPLAGIAWSLVGLPIPVPAARFLDLLGSAAGPCALFAIGLFLAGQTLHANLTEVGWITVLKLVWHPIIMWALIAFVFPMDPFWAMCAIMLAALPTGALTFVVAQNYDVYVDRSSGVIFVSTVVSVITLSLLLAIYGPQFGVG